MSAITIPEDFDKRIASAAEFFWAARSGQLSRQHETGRHDQGNRGAVTAGKQLDGFLELIKDILILNDVPAKSIFTDSDLE